MKICYLNRDNPLDHNSWSGTHFQMFSRLRQSHQVDWVGQVELNRFEKKLLHYHKRLNERLNKKYTSFNFLHCFIYGRKLNKKINSEKYDIIFAPAGFDYLFFIKTDVPIIYFSDATFQLLMDYYQEYSNWPKGFKWQANQIEKKALRTATKVIFSSRWAAQSAVDFYGAKKDKISVIDFGPNLLSAPDKKNLNLGNKWSEVCQILFLGVDWNRKGGDIAYKAFLKLRERGFNCRLTIVGCSPKLEEGKQDISIIPFFDKNELAGFTMLSKIFSNSHLLLLPTRADCTPIVFSEAASFGIPVITTDTGGISSVIKDGVNGYMLPVDANEDAYADKIQAVFEDKELYEQLCKSSRNEFERRLSWDVWLHKFNQVAASILSFGLFEF